ncbi:ABC transporter substrate-binding protein [Alsobacter sp. SYSU M60028]|uniref:ABC transporter substrate-binding protein n=1 Tax=Alsobacter ponti TaxID=2962936 RepID=A0ABT1LB88_9HYPH|nr:ABC transporter substrate-binding protein [Alsobacter ponti]MCP8938241.1 ABC transporter substrate-binding protein [Alsobacter ponti]
MRRPAITAMSIWGGGIRRRTRSALSTIIIGAAAAFALATGAHSQDLKLINPGELTVVSLADQPGTSFVDAKGEVQGMAVDLMNAIAGKLGVKVTYRTAPIATVISAVSVNQYDTAAAGLAVTEERKKSVDFSIPWNYGQLTVIVRNKLSSNDVEGLKGKTLGVITGSVQEQYARANFGGVDIKNFQQQPAMVNALLANQIDALMVGSYDGSTYLARYPELSVPFVSSSDVYNAFPVAKTRPEFLAAMNRAMEELFDDGTWMKIYKKWYATIAVPKQLLEQHPKLKQQ